MHIDGLGKIKRPVRPPVNNGKSFIHTSVPPKMIDDDQGIVIRRKTAYAVGQRVVQRETRLVNMIKQAFPAFSDPDILVKNGGNGKVDLFFCDLGINIL